MRVQKLAALMVLIFNHKDLAFMLSGRRSFWIKKMLITVTAHQMNLKQYVKHSELQMLHRVITDIAVT